MITAAEAKKLVQEEDARHKRAEAARIAREAKERAARLAEEVDRETPIAMKGIDAGIRRATKDRQCEYTHEFNATEEGQAIRRRCADNLIALGYSCQLNYRVGGRGYSYDESDEPAANLLTIRW